MGTATLNTAVENLFATAWGATTPVCYDNVPFTTPTSTQAWVKLELWDGSTVKASVGSGAQLRRSFGTVFFTIYAPINAGTLLARTLADSISAIFRDKQVSGATFEDADFSRLGEVAYVGTGVIKGSGNWYQLKVAIPFKYDEII
jgi:hypothetical protein